MDAPTFSSIIVPSLVAALVPMILGAIWYGPLFGRKWMEMIAKTEEELKANFNPAKTYGIMYALNVVMALVFSHVLWAFGFALNQTGWMSGVQGGFWLWLGFVLTIGWQHVAFEDQKIGLYILNQMFNLASLIGMGIVLAVWN